MDWTYSVLAENIEYLSEGDVLEESYNVHLSENFVNYIKDDVAQLDINLEIVGTNDQPEIVVEAVDDINVFLREGQNDTASGQLQISERDVNDRVSLSLEMLQSNIRESSRVSRKCFYSSPN